MNRILYDLASEEPFSSHLNGWNIHSPVLTVDEYVQILFDNGLQNINVFQKVYPIIAEEHDSLFNFISGSTLIPYLERLDDDQQKVFITEFKQRIAEAFPKLPAVYSFKRILMYGRRDGV